MACLYDIGEYTLQHPRNDNLSCLYPHRHASYNSKQYTVPGLASPLAFRVPELTSDTLLVNPRWLLWFPSKSLHVSATFTSL